MTSMFFFAIPFIIVIAYVPKGLVGKVVLVFVAILSGFGTAAGFYLSSCMLNDVIVEDYIKTKNNREGAFSSIFIFFQKVSVGCAHGLTGLIIQWSGTVTKKPDGSFAKEQPKSIINAIRYGASVLPLFSVLCCIFWLYLYPLTKEKVQSNQEKINEMRKV
ncbi:hypothetical protein MHBO_000171 [Bonamia ostreae]|uniref:Uncharacterized protein n=1 Tax=Bonamia ostreae TaxID=126728 RepID=A0ABV2AEP9_9EUKA